MGGGALRRWWEKRLPRLRWSAETTYIVPTLPGFLLLGGALAVFLLAAVYRNDILYVHGFALLSIFFLGMLLTHANLRRVRVAAHAPGDPFAGTSFALTLTLENTTDTGCAAVGVRLVPGGRVTPRRSRFGRARTHSEASPQDATKHAMPGSPREAAARFAGASTTAHVPYLEKKGTRRVHVTLRAEERGRFPSFAAFVTSRSPLGLFVAWRVSGVSLPSCVLAEPKGTLALPRNDGTEGETPGNDTSLSAKERRQPAQQDLDGLAPLRPGDVLSRVVWRRFAPRGLADTRPLVRTLQTEARKHVVLSWNAASRHGTGSLEATLSQLTEWLLACRGSGMSCDVDTPYWKGHDLDEAGCEDALRAFAVVPPQGNDGETSTA